jgi:hypothetical protein
MFRKKKTSELAEPKGMSQRCEYSLTTGVNDKLEPAVIGLLFSIIVLMLMSGHKKQEGKCLR